MKKSLVILLVLGLSFGVAATARAANELIGLSMEAKPAGALYKEVHRPVAASLTVTVSAPDNEPLITPLKVANVTFPRDMSFFPNPRTTPVCPESKLNDQSNLAAGVAAIVSLCQRSVVGTGTAVVQLAQLKSGAVSDPKLVIFNAGRTGSGRPKILIYGYSKTVNSGLLMRGTLARNGELRISIGVLPFDSSVSSFTLGVPGEPLAVDDSDGSGEAVTVQGLDPNYLRAVCSTGTWLASGSFVLGSREHPSGTATSPETLLSSNAFELGCRGLPGKGALRVSRVAGPTRVKSGRRATYQLTVTNRGTATAKAIRISARGAATGRRALAVLPPGQSRKVRMPVRISPKRGVRNVRFAVTGRGLGTKSVVRKLAVG